MVTDHKQSYRGDENLSPEERVKVPDETLWLDEERRRTDARRQVFPDLPQYVPSRATPAEVGKTGR